MTALPRLLALGLTLGLTGCLINTELRDDRLDALDVDDDCEPSPEVCDGVDNDCNGKVDDGTDADGDGVSDLCDTCPGGDDGLDSDGDGEADACDPCPLDAPPDDDDGDGVCNSDDVCPDGSDVSDVDLDGVADGCDTCPWDAGNDIDGDGQCANLDNCPSTVDCQYSSIETLARPQDLSIRAPQGTVWSFGAALHAPTDLTGDGVPDLVVGAPATADGTQPGRVFVFEGPLDHDMQLVADGNGNPTLDHLLAVIEGAPGDRFGAAFDVVPDVNGDGLPELWVGAPDAEVALDGDGLDEGEAWLVPSPFAGEMDGLAHGWHLGCTTEEALCGNAVLAISIDPASPQGTVLLAGAPGENNPITGGTGVLAVHLGPPAGSGTIDLVGDADARIYDDTGLNLLVGYRLAEVGDLTGDGIAEVALTAPPVAGAAGQGLVCLLDLTALTPGTDVGLSSLPCWSQEDTDDTFFGSSVSAVPDLDSDGHRELLIGDKGETGNSGGQAWLVYSNGAPLTSQWGGILGGAYPTVGAATQLLGPPTHEIGTGLTASDLDGDGLPELVLGGDEGDAYVAWGSDLTAPGQLVTLNFQARVVFRRSRVLGSVLAPAGDLNGDGKADLLVADPGHADGAVPQGEVLVVWGADSP